LATPTTAEAWLLAVQKRAVDARILADQGRSVAAVYLAGYAVERALKAYLQKRTLLSNGIRG
jgi:hypothetical protein